MNYYLRIRPAKRETAGTRHILFVAVAVSSNRKDMAVAEAL